MASPSGKPGIISRIVLEPRTEVWRNWEGRTHGKVREGRFALHGLTPMSRLPSISSTPGASWRDGESLRQVDRPHDDRESNRPRRAGATIAFGDKSVARGPITVKLEPCGAARARFVDRDGKPVAARLSRDVRITMVATPGPPYSRVPDKAGLLFAEEADLNQVDPINYANELVPDAEGRATVSRFPS